MQSVVLLVCVYACVCVCVCVCACVRVRVIIFTLKKKPKSRTLWIPEKHLIKMKKINQTLEEGEGWREGEGTHTLHLSHCGALSPVVLC